MAEAVPIQQQEEEELPSFYRVIAGGEAYWAIPLAEGQSISPALYEVLMEMGLGMLVERTRRRHPSAFEISGAPCARRFLLLQASMDPTWAYGPTGQLAICFGGVVTVWVASEHTCCARADFVRPRST